PSATRAAARSARSTWARWTWVPWTWSRWTADLSRLPGADCVGGADGSSRPPRHRFRWRGGVHFADASGRSRIDRVSEGIVRETMSQNAVWMHEMQWICTECG